MAPCIADKNILVERETANSLQLISLKNAIPKEAFKKSLVKSTYYMIFDYMVWFGTVGAMYKLTQSTTWSGLPFWQQAIATIIFWNIAGFYMWCLFMIGHDCGHSTFSNYSLVNDIVGHIAHGSLLVPYFPWQVFFFSMIVCNTILTVTLTAVAPAPPHVSQPHGQALLAPLVHPGAHEPS